MADVELIQFPFSHFNEKARWALDWKGIAHERTNLLPGPHQRTVRKLTGQTQVPAMRIGGETVFGSARILETLEARFPEPALLPAEPAERARALALQRTFDEEIGPEVRRAFFSIVVDHPGYLCAMFARGQPLPARVAYRCMFPFVKGLMRREMEIFEPHVSRAFEETQRGFDLVAGTVGPSGHLVGDRFSVADLAACSLLAPAVDVEHPDMRKPAPRPPPVQGWLDRWADHPGADWVRKTYARHRGA